MKPSGHIPNLRTRALPTRETSFPPRRCRVRLLHEREQSRQVGPKLIRRKLSQWHRKLPQHPRGIIVSWQRELDVSDRPRSRSFRASDTQNRIRKAEDERREPQVEHTTPTRNTFVHFSIGR